MADAAVTPIRTRPPLMSDGGTLGQSVDFDVRGSGGRLPKAEAPEGWVKKIERREGKVWVGFFHLWTTDAQGRRVRTKKEKMLGAASTPKHEAQQISTFTELWKAFCAVKSGQWSMKTRENLQCLFGKHVVPSGSKPCGKSR